jgi:hypothetical protein
MHVFGLAGCSCMCSTWWSMWSHYPFLLLGRYDDWKAWFNGSRFDRSKMTKEEMDDMRCNAVALIQRTWRTSHTLHSGEVPRV